MVDKGATAFQYQRIQLEVCAQCFYKKCRVHLEVIDKVTILIITYNLS